MTAVPTTLPLSKIKPGDNPRRYFDRTKHEELVASLRLRGMLQPMLLRPVEDAFVVIAGERRYRAALEAFGADGNVPVIVREMSDQEALEAAIDENDVRDDASETEQADAAVRVLAACQDDRAEAARRLGWSVAKLDRRLALANLSEAVKLALNERRIKVGHAELLAAVPGDKQEKALDTILGAGLEVSKTRELLMRMTQSLGAATFDKAECTTCPFNAGTQRALFETHVDDGHCTNAGCFQLKTEAADAQRAANTNSGAAGGEKDPADMPGDAHPSTPDRAPDPCPDQAPAPASSKPKLAKGAASAKPAAAAKPKVSAEGLAAKLEPNRKAAWRNAVATALTESADTLRVADIAAGLVRSGAAVDFDQVGELVEEFEVDLRTTWRVNGTFFALLTKDELKFVAIECGVMAHVGEKKFANLLAAPASDLISGLLHVTGFDWAGHLPSAMTLDGQYGPPPVVVAPASIEKV